MGCKSRFAKLLLERWLFYKTGAELFCKIGRLAPAGENAYLEGKFTKIGNDEDKN